jgi:hypothetical protein
MATQPIAQSPATLSNAEGHIKFKVVKKLKTPPTCFLFNGRHPANYKGCMVHREPVSARNIRNSQYEGRSNDRTTLKKQQQVSNNAQNSSLSLAQAVIGVPADSKSNNNHNSTVITTQLTIFLSEFKNMFS